MTKDNFIIGLLVAVLAVSLFGFSTNKSKTLGATDYSQVAGFTDIEVSKTATFLGTTTLSGTVVPTGALSGYTTSTLTSLTVSGVATTASLVVTGNASAATTTSAYKSLDDFTGLASTTCGGASTTVIHNGLITSCY